MSGPFGMRQRPRRPAINITPLIDVMFLLLIFFMVSATFRQFPGIDISLPVAATAEPQEQRGHTVYVTAAGALLLDNQEVTVPGLRLALAEILERQPDARLVLEAHGRAPFEAVVTAMDIAREVGGSRLIIATEPLPAPAEDARP